MERNMRDQLAFALAAALAVLCSLSGVASAQVAIDGTRVVFPADSAEVTVAVRNTGDAPALLQVWIGDGDRKKAPEASSAPFAVAPPMLRLEAGKDKKLRIRLIRNRAPTDAREHLYWLNLLAAPPRANPESNENLLQLATRSRFKVLYRPKAIAATLPGNFADSMAFTLRRAATGLELVIANPTAYYFNLGRVALVRGGEQQPLENPYVAPFSEVRLPIPATASDAPLRVDFSWLDDFGQLTPGSRPVSLPPGP